MSFEDSSPALGHALEREGTGAEPDLVRKARLGDGPARDELVKRHRRPVYFLALQLLGNADDALDVTQDTLLRFFDTLHRFDDHRPVRPWLFRIARNRILDLFRRQRIRRHESLDAIPEGEDHPRLDVVDESVDVEKEMAQKQLRRRLWQALEQLSANQREIVVLRDYQDLSYNEIAETLNIPIGTVMSRLHGARQRLRVLLSDELRIFDN